MVPSSIAKCEKGKGLPTMSTLFPQNCVFYQIEIRRTVLKQPTRTEYLIKQKPRGALALQINKGSLTQEKGLIEEVGSCQSFFL